VIKIPVQQDSSIPGYSQSRDGYRLSGRQQMTRVVLTDTQIKALGTIEVLAAPGAGLMYIFRSALVTARFTTGYTNIDAADSDFNIQLDAEVVAVAANDAGFSALFGSAGQKVLPVAAAGGLLDSSDIEDQPMDIVLANGDGALTGGNAANTLEVQIWYSVARV